MKIRLLISFIFLTMLNSCEKNETYYFNGEIIYANEFKSEKNLKGTEVFFDEAYEGQMMVHDSIMLFLSKNPTDYWMHAYNLNTGKLLAKFCKKGEGPDDFLLCTTFEQFIENDGDVKLWVNDYIKSSRLINITQSIVKGDMVCDSVIPMKWIEHHRFPTVGMFFLDDGDFLAKHQCELSYLNDEEYIPRNYKRYHRNLDNEQEHYIHYKRPIESEKMEEYYMMYYASCDRIKPDLKKVAMSMQMLPQINIWDLDTNTLKGYRQKGGMSFFDLGSAPDKYRYYYMKMCVSNQFILAPYVDKPIREIPETSCVHVFDWDGNPLYKLHLTESIYGIALDDKKWILYAYDLNDHIYSYDVSFLNNNL